MTRAVSAVYEQGVLRLKEPVALADGADVEVIIITHDAVPLAEQAAAILEELAAMPMEQDDGEFSGRDHDAILYGRKE